MSAQDSPRLAEEFRKAEPEEVRADCPPAERIWAAVAGELSVDEVCQTVDHTAHCRDCSIAWRVALEVSREDDARVALAPVLRFRTRIARAFLLPGLGLAAAAVAVFLLRGPTTHPVGKGLSDVERGAKSAMVSLTPPGVQPRSAIVLRWSPYPSAQRYSVTVMSSSLHVLYRAFGVLTTELRLPPESVSGLPSPARVFWSVEATLPGGGVVASEVFTLDFQ